MWYKNAWRRHLCDMHIDDWKPDFLSQFDPDTYVENLKRANVKNAMIYFQSHVGLCYYPTKSGRMHNAFVGRENMMKRVERLCHEAGISVTGYYSLIYNNYAHDLHPEWRIVGPDGKSAREKCLENDLGFAAKGVTRYGTCCPNNMEYRAFVKEQIHEIAEYFDFEGFFFDMLFWPGGPCFCDSCKVRWAREVGNVNMPGLYDTEDPNWQLHIEKRREWMGEFAMWATKELKVVAPHASVEHNFASGITHVNHRCVDERVNDACDYAGGDLYDDLYRHSFACKFYRHITKNQPFEYMFSRCEPDLGMHTTIKPEDAMASAMFITAAHHGATLIIDAIDPVGTMDERVYQQIGDVFARQIPYEPYLGQGEMIDDIGLYYSMKSKPVIYNPLSNHDGALFAAETLIRNNLCFGVTSGCMDIDRYKTLIVPCPGIEDTYDNERLIKYVENGGKLYFSGIRDPGLLKAFFGAECKGYTEERITYIAPNGRYPEGFGWFNQKYPLQFCGNAPKVKGIDPKDVIATVTLPYTKQDVVAFASIHSNPPGIPTELPAVAVKQYGRGTVLWSAFPIECRRTAGYMHAFYLLISNVLKPEQMITSDAPQDVEVIGFQLEDAIQINVVQLNEAEKARYVEDFPVSVKCNPCPQQVTLLPGRQSVPFRYEDGTVSFTVSGLHIFAMYEVR